MQILKKIGSIQNKIVVIILLQLFFYSCQTKTNNQVETDKINMNSDSLKTKLDNKIFTSQRLDSIQKIYPDSILIKEAKSIFGFDLFIINNRGKVSYSSIDLNNDGLKERVITIEGDFDIGFCKIHIVFLNKGDFYMIAGKLEQAQHEGPIDFTPIHLDENNRNYFLLNTQGWGSGFYAIHNSLYKIENDTIIEKFNYTIHSSYVLDFGNYPPMEVVDCTHLFLNDSVLQLNIEIYYIELLGNEAKSRTFKETVKLLKIDNGEELNSFKVIESTNPEFIKEEIFPPMTFYHLYGDRLSSPYFINSWKEFNSQ